jgi:hypothetical protein
MGAWGTGIKDNDTSSDIYADFFDLYNLGQSLTDISAKIIADNKDLIDNPDDCNNFWFALALAQWETKSLDPEILSKVKTIISEGNDIIIWRALDADEADLKKRKAVLDKFLEKLQTEKKRAKSRQKPETISAEPPFSKGNCLTFKLDNGNYGGAVVLSAKVDAKLGGKNYVATTRINQPHRPTLNDFKTAEVLITNYFGDDGEPAEMFWLFANDYSISDKIVDLVGSIPVSKTYEYGGIGTITGSGWDIIKYCADRQFAFEISNPAPIKKMTIAEVTNSGPWWKFW